MIELFLNSGQYIRVPVTDIADTNAGNQVNICLTIVAMQVNAFGPVNFKGERKIGCLGNVLKKQLPVGNLLQWKIKLVCYKGTAFTWF